MGPLVFQERFDAITFASHSAATVQAMERSRKSEEVLIFIDDGSADPFDTTQNYIWYQLASPIETRRAWRKAEQLWQTRVAAASHREIRPPRRYVSPTFAHRAMREAMGPDAARIDPTPNTKKESDEALQEDLGPWLGEYNEQHSHQGRWRFGKTPIGTFLTSLKIAIEKNVVGSGQLSVNNPSETD